MSTVPVKKHTTPLWRRDPLELVDWMEDWWDRPLLSALRPFRDGGKVEEWKPRVDVFEQKGKLVVKAELPGIEKKDLGVEFEDGDLLLKGERKEEKEVKKDDYYRCERIYGSFFRRIPLGFEVAPEEIKAQFKDGILEVRVPMPKEKKGAVKTIEVN